jgi:hypothetical protein
MQIHILRTCPFNHQTVNEGLYASELRVIATTGTIILSLLERYIINFNRLLFPPELLN